MRALIESIQALPVRTLQEAAKAAMDVAPSIEAIKAAQAAMDVAPPIEAIKAAQAALDMAPPIRTIQEAAKAAMDVAPSISAIQETAKQLLEISVPANLIQEMAQGILPIPIPTQFIQESVQDLLAISTPARMIQETAQQLLQTAFSADMAQQLKAASASLSEALNPPALVSLNAIVQGLKYQPSTVNLLNNLFSQLSPSELLSPKVTEAIEKALDDKPILAESKNWTRSEKQNAIVIIQNFILIILTLIGLAVSISALNQTKPSDPLPENCPTTTPVITPSPSQPAGHSKADSLDTNQLRSQVSEPNKRGSADVD